MKISKIILGCVLILGILFCSCSPKKQTLKIGLNADYPPFEYKEQDVLSGIDIDLAHRLGESMGYNIEFVEMEFDELLPALNRSRIDLVISAMTINQQRLQIVDFSLPYFSADQALIASESFTNKIDQITDIAEFQIGMQNGTTGQYFLQYNDDLKDIVPWQHLHAFDNNNQAISALMNDEIQLLIMDDSAARAFSQIKPLKIIHLIKTDDQYGIAMRKNYELKQPLNQALNQIINSSYWTNIITQYMGK